MGKDWPTHRVSDIFQITLSDMRQCRACHYHPTCAFASERQSREEGVEGEGGNYGGSTLSQAVDLVRGSLSLLISDEISNLQTWINISPVLHLALLSKDLRILNHGVCLLGTDSCTIWSLFCDGIHEMGDAYHMRNAP